MDMVAERTSGSHGGDVRGCSGKQTLEVCGVYDALQHDVLAVFGVLPDVSPFDALEQV